MTSAGTSSSSCESGGPLPTRALEYKLPAGLVATHPAEPRDSARLLVMHRSTADIEHCLVTDLPRFLTRGDLLVFNDSAVVPARLLGRRADTGGSVEGLFVCEAADRTWRVMLRSNGRLRPGNSVVFGGEAGAGPECRIELIEKHGGEWTVRPERDGPALAILSEIGSTPLPPYIRRARKQHHEDYRDEQDRQWYQTVYADRARQQSVAAPTAGLHFTPELLERIDRQEVEQVRVTLHVGPGTFKPIAADTVDEHPMHSERYSVSPEALASLRAAKQGRQRVIAIGTTAVRTLESLSDPLPEDAGVPISAETDLLIVPPYEFGHVDGMLTNFHLPRSTLLALVGAMVGLDRLLAVYREAVEREYRFYSYGDAMLILP